MRILVNDFSGGAYEIELSRELARRGHSVRHVFFADNLSTTKGETWRREDDPPSFAIEGLHIPFKFSKHSIRNRRKADIAYGMAVSAEVAAFGPNVVISANMPLDAQTILLESARKQNAEFSLDDRDLKLRHTLCSAKEVGSARALDLGLLRAARRETAREIEWRRVQHSGNSEACYGMGC